MAYTLTLHFTAGDRTVNILREGYRSGNQVGAKGRHATQTCQLSIRSYEISAMLLQEEAPLIRAELKENSTVIFQGVVRPYQTVSAKNATENVFSLQLMDDTEILKNTAIEDQEEFLDKDLAWCVQYLYDMADLPEDLNLPDEFSNISVPFFNLSPDKYPKVADQLEAMLWEYGYDYKFSGSDCNVIRTWIESPEGLEVLKVRNTLKVQRDDNWSDGVKVNYGIMEICRQIPLAKWKEDVSDLQWWRYALPWSYSTSSGTARRTVAYEPFYSYPEGSKPKDFKPEYILSAQNCRADASNCEVVSITPHAQSIEIEFSWNVTQNYVWGNPIADWPYIAVTGDIIYAVPGDYQENIVGEKPDEFTLFYIRSEEGAKAFAEREYKRAKCAPVTFSFQSLDHYEAGSFCRLTDNVTGIDVVVRILSCSLGPDKIYSVTAESADYIGMSVETEDLKLRDALDLGADVVLTASTDTVGEGSSVTVTASGRLLDIIESEGDETFVYEWELNGVHVPEWDDQKQVTATFAFMGDDDNVFKFNVYHVEAGQKILIGFGLISALKYVEGKDGESAEIQYAVGDSITDPPQGDMLWNSVPMQWDEENMCWNAVEYTDDVPDMQRARYIWMRTRVGDNEWQYTRLTGSTSWDPENLGVATTETPKQSKEGLGLVNGDYFVAGATFTEDGVTYSAGFAYVYNGTSWEGMDITSADNARKASDLLDSLITGNVQIPSSNNQCSMWLWAKNFVAQNAVVDNLFSQAITILTGGHIKGGDRYDDTGAILDYSEKGFYLGADGTLKGNLQSDFGDNTIVGTEALVDADAEGNASYDNTAIGFEALASGFRTSRNVAVGKNALHDLAGSGSSGNAGKNTAVGYGALSNSNGVQGRSEGNTALGHTALNGNTTGSFNVGIGTGVNCPKVDGHYQMNINDAIIHLEFKDTRSGSQIAAVLAGIDTSGTTVGAMGVFDDLPVIAIKFGSSSVTIVTLNGTTIQSNVLSGHSSSTYYSTRTVLTFINPALSGSSRSDCLGL